MAGGLIIDRTLPPGPVQPRRSHGRDRRPWSREPGPALPRKTPAPSAYRPSPQYGSRRQRSPRRPPTRRRKTGATRGRGGCRGARPPPRSRSRLDIEAVRADDRRRPCAAKVDQALGDLSPAGAISHDLRVLEEPRPVRQVGQPAFKRQIQNGLDPRALGHRRGRQATPVAASAHDRLELATRIDDGIDRRTPSTILDPVEDRVDDSRQSAVALVARLGKGDPRDRFSRRRTGNEGREAACGGAPPSQREPLQAQGN